MTVCSGVCSITGCSDKTPAPCKMVADAVAMQCRPGGAAADRNPHRRIRCAQFATAGVHLFESVLWVFGGFLGFALAPSRRALPLRGAALALRCFAAALISGGFCAFTAPHDRAGAQALPLCGAAPTFLCRGVTIQRL